MSSSIAPESGLSSSPVAESAHICLLDESWVAQLSQLLPRRFLVPTNVEAEADFLASTRDALSWLASDIARATQSCRGLAILTGPNIQDLSDGQLCATVYSISLLLGRPVSQNSAGEKLVLVANQQGSSSKRARGYQTDEGMLLHSDPSDLASLLCLSPSDSGGDSLFASASTIHDAIADTDPGLLPTYYRPWNWNVQNLEVPGIGGPLQSPIFSVCGGELSCRYGSSMLRNGFDDAGHPLAGADLEALDLFEEIARRPDVVLRYRLRRGESVWMNNYKLLHGRDPFVDDARGRQVRRFMRVWVQRHDRPRVAPNFAAFSDQVLSHYPSDCGVTGKLSD